jgi:hypothetical protein
MASLGTDVGETGEGNCKQERQNTCTTRFNPNRHAHPVQHISTNCFLSVFKLGKVKDVMHRSTLISYRDCYL